MESFKPIDVKTLQENVFRLMDDDWMLVTAGEPDYFNTMTASWGGMGILWERPIALAFVRPQRFTRKFMDGYPSFTLSFFSEKHREVLEICGAKSGRNFNKVEAAGITPLLTEEGNMYFKESRLFLECRKLYQDDFQEHMFLQPEIAKKFYPSKDFHRFYIGEIVHAWMNVTEK